MDGMITQILVASTTMFDDDFGLFDDPEEPPKKARGKSSARERESAQEQAEIPTDQGLAGTLDACFDREPYQPKDSAVADLAMMYAEQIDQGGDIIRLGPLFLNALEALHMSPRARAVAKKGMKQNEPSAAASRDPIDELAKRRAGKSGA